MKRYLTILNVAYSLLVVYGCGSGSANTTLAPPPPPPTVTHLSVTPSATTVSAGSGFSIVVSALDVGGGVVSAYSGIVHFTSSDAQAILPANTPLTNGTGNFSVTLETTGNQTITATDTVTASITGSTGQINVVSNTVTHLGITAPGSTTTRAAFAFAVTALDAANNPVASYSGTVHIASSDGKALLPADTQLVNGTADLSATFETVGTQSITATDTVTTSLTVNSGPINVTVPPALSITSGQPPNGVVGSGYNPHEVRVCLEPQPPPGSRCLKWGEKLESFFPLTSSGGVTPNGVTWSWVAAPGSSLPPGLTIASGGDEITGTPSAGSVGAYNVVITVADTGTPPAQTSANYSITINNPPAPVVNTTPAPQQGVENAPYTYTFTASGAQPFTWSESGALPNGLAFSDATGVLSGTATVLGSFPITVTVTDQYNQNSAPANFTIVISQHGFVVTGNMITSRVAHTATLLSSGKVLVAGGTDASGTTLAFAELYDPSSGSFSQTGTMATGRSSFAAVLLGDGNVLVTGGLDASGLPLASAEIYNPTAAAFSPTQGTMTAARANHTATLLNTGKVLIVGGGGATAELFDPTTGTFTATSSMLMARASHTATLLNSGKVLIAGGVEGALPAASTVLSEAELYDPAAGTFSQTTGSLATAREGHAASLLSSGKVLLTGGLDGSGNAIPTGEVFDPASESFTPTGGNLASARALQTSTTLADGTVLVTGGTDGTAPLTTAELYDPTAGTFSLAATMASARASHTATLLNNGHVLVTGGASTSTAAIATAEVYQ